MHTPDGVLGADHVVVATGHDRVPVVPRWTGEADFTGRLAHVSEIRSPGALAGHRVVVVGAGNSGIEIAGRLVDAGVERLWLSARSVPTILPCEVLGIPVQPAAVALRVLPERTRDRAARRVSRVAFGDLAPFGLPAPPDGPFERMRTTGVTAAVDQGFVAHLKAGRARVVAPVVRFSTGGVVLRDGRVLDVDTVVAATGYRPGLEPLVGHLGVLDAAGRPDARTAAELGLWFVGFRPAVEGNLRQHPVEARKVARAIARRAAATSSSSVSVLAQRLA